MNPFVEPECVEPLLESGFGRAAVGASDPDIRFQVEIIEVAPGQIGGTEDDRCCDGIVESPDASVFLTMLACL